MNANAAYQDILDDLFGRVDRAQVFSGGVRQGRPMEDGVRLEVTGAECAGLREVLRVLEPETPFHSMYYGDQAIQLQAEGQVLAVIGVYRGISIRIDGWHSEAKLVDGAGLLEYFAARGFSEPLQAFRAAEKKRAERDDARARWLKSVPEGLVAYLETLENTPIGHTSDAVLHAPTTALRAMAPEAGLVARSVLAWYGSGVGSWSQHPEYEEVPAWLLLHLGTQAVLDALAVAADCPKTWLGAARYFQSVPFSNLRRPDRHLLTAEVRETMLAHVLATRHEENLKRIREALHVPAPIVADNPGEPYSIGIAEFGQFDAVQARGGYLFAKDGRTVVRYKLGDSEGTVIHQHPDGWFEFRAMEDGGICIADLAHGQLLRSLAGKETVIATNRFRPFDPVWEQGRVFWIEQRRGSLNTSVVSRIWGIEPGKAEPIEYATEDGSVTNLVSADGRLAWFCYQNDTLNVRTLNLEDRRIETLDSCIKTGAPDNTTKAMTAHGQSFYWAVGAVLRTWSPAHGVENIATLEFDVRTIAANDHSILAITDTATPQHHQLLQINKPHRQPRILYNYHSTATALAATQDAAIWTMNEYLMKLHL